MLWEELLKTCFVDTNLYVVSMLKEKLVGIHGLPVELAVEKKLEITKEDIGKKISVEDYNKACKESVLVYTDVWNDLTKKMGYWVDMENHTITPNLNIESVWSLIKTLFKKDLLLQRLHHSLIPLPPERV